MYGSNKISYYDALDNGEYLSYVVKSTDVDIEGTDGNQFKPFLDKDSTIKYHNSYLNRVIRLEMDNKDQDDINYKVDLGITSLLEQTKLDLIVSEVNSQGN